MTNLYKEVLYIIILSVFLGFIRYLFLDDYKLLNPKVEKSISIVDYEDVNLRNYLLELSSPKVIDIEKAKFIYDHDLAIFIDAREKEDYVEGLILNDETLILLINELIKHKVFETNDYIFTLGRYRKYFSKIIQLQDWSFIFNRNQLLNTPDYRTF